MDFAYLEQIIQVVLYHTWATTQLMISKMPDHGNVNDSTSNLMIFYITGVQLEVGDTATSFEHRSISEEL